MIPIETIKELAAYHGAIEGGYYRSSDDSSVYTYTFDESEFIAFSRAIEAMTIDRCAKFLNNSVFSSDAIDAVFLKLKKELK